MGLPKEQEEQESPFSPIQRLIIEVSRVVSGRTERKEKKLGEKKARFFAIGETLAQNIGAFNGLFLEEDFEREFFVERLSVHLFDSLCPLRAGAKSEETLNGKINNFDEDLDKYFGVVFTFTGSLLERALDNAARSVFLVLKNSLKNAGLNQKFAQDVIKFYKNGKTTPLLTTLFQVDPNVKEALEFVFQRNREEIAKLRQTVEAPLQSFGLKSSIQK